MRKGKEMSILDKLMKVQTELKAPKSQFNKFGNYYYRNIEDIYEGLKPLLTKHKVSIIMTDSVEVIGEEKYIKATARFLDVESGDSIENSAYAKEGEAKGMSNSQMIGSCSSYARKYALGGLLLLDDNKDDDSNEAHEEKQNRQKAAAKEKATEQKIEDVENSTIGEAKVKALRAKLEESGVDVEKFCKLHKVNNLGMIKEKQFNSAVKNWDKVVEMLK